MFFLSWFFFYKFRLFFYGSIIKKKLLIEIVHILNQITHKVASILLCDFAPPAPLYSTQFVIHLLARTFSTASAKKNTGNQGNHQDQEAGKAKENCVIQQFFISLLQVILSCLFYCHFCFVFVLFYCNVCFLLSCFVL